jgi:hypothetical protein
MSEFYNSHLLFMFEVIPFEEEHTPKVVLAIYICHAVINVHHFAYIGLSGQCITQPLYRRLHCYSAADLRIQRPHGRRFAITEIPTIDKVTFAKSNQSVIGRCNWVSIEYTRLILEFFVPRVNVVSEGKRRHTLERIEELIRSSKINATFDKHVNKLR